MSELQAAHFDGPVDRLSGTISSQFLARAVRPGRSFPSAGLLMPVDDREETSWLK